MNKKFFSILCFVVLSTALSAVAQPTSSLFTSDSLLMFLPFKDKSGFKGKWNITTDVPRFLTAYMKERFRVGVVSPVSVKRFLEWKEIDSNRVYEPGVLQQCAERFRVRYLVVGTIEEFSISRFMVSEVQLAGYEAFAAEVRISFALYDAARAGKGGSNGIVYEGDAEGLVKDRNVGLTLFGKQTERMSQYFLLDDLAFGSDAFNGTIIGEALLKCGDDLGTKLERAVPNLVSKSVVLSSSVVIDSAAADSAIVLKRHLVNGEIVIVDDNEVFINLGSQDGINIGDLLPVFSEGEEIKDPNTGETLGNRDEKIGEIQVIEIRAEHLSLATIVTGKGTIAPKNRIRKVLIR
ncbi:MAG: hypothetical protein HYV29_05850 [Ignavibacteriales bacterium]|nr:hypothetical protein [Ignavibacteriales bacterium]